MTGIHYQRAEDGIVTLLMDAPGQSANLMDAAFRAEFAEAVARLRGETGLRGVILTSAKKTFFAGGDLKELISLQPEDRAPFFHSCEKLKADMRALETLDVPVVAALNGTALGGGFELALCCHRRIALDDRKLLIGLPEVTLGLIPGAGGVTRLVRLLGLQAALPLLLEGKQLNAPEALRQGLVHELAADATELLAKARAWILERKRSLQLWDQGDYKLPGGTPSNPKVAPVLMIAPAMLRSKTRGCYPAPEAILAAAVEGAQVDLATALRIESRQLTRIASGQIAKNMIGAFWFQLNEIKAGRSRPTGFAPWRAQCVGVIGAGMMGSGIAHACAIRQTPVVLKDISLAAAERGKAHAEKLLAKRVQRGQQTAEAMAATLALIQPTADAADFARCDLVIEAVFEQRELKAQVTREAEAHLPAHGVMSSNTSTLPISGLAEASRAPEKFIGLHFFSPVDKMQLVEIIKGRATDAETLARAFDFVLQIGKIPIVVNDSRGFFTSRVFGKFVEEGFAMLHEGIAPSAIEMAALKAGMPVGPLAVADEVSLGLIDHIAAQTKADFAAEGRAWKPSVADPVRERMVGEFRRLGRAAGGGFYEYPAEGEKRLWPGLSVWRRGDVNPSERELIDRFLFVQALDTVRCLEERVLESVRDANIGSIFGIGFPAWTGGAVQFLNQYGLPAALARAEELAARHGERFAPPELLRKAAVEGKAIE
ncbi:MAG: enoyl-CoA hydratase/isomerase family protein [Verrucomicrobia bacterium]|nr:enoyl-CoA hydratase/isomerase family protein [Verrucomicrobiota bacterium]